MLLDAVASGALHLTAVTLIAPHLTVDNVDRAIAAATHKARCRRTPCHAAPSTSVASSVRRVSQDPRKSLTLVKFTASRAMHEKLREAQALLRHQLRLGDVAEIFDRALTLLLADLRKADVLPPQCRTCSCAVAPTSDSRRSDGQDPVKRISFERRVRSTSAEFAHV